MPRHTRPGRSSAVAALVLLLCAAFAFAEGDGDGPARMGLRSTLPASGGKSAQLSPSGDQTFGAPPASGAGDTGFVSAEQAQYRLKNRKKKKPETALAETVTRPAAR
ncbi:MAG TPA: hypothetical protein VIH65_03960, partial [Xanthobacteraceae bacterium]